jgi:NADH-quinone oxidoreductase subunit J
MPNLFNIIAQSTAAPSLAAQDVLPYACIILGAIGYFALQYGVLRNRAVGAIGVLLLAAAGVLAAWNEVTSLDTLTLFLFVALAILGSSCFVVLREPVYAALGFATAVLSSCGVLFMQYAYFVAAATMIVYAGATIIIFLFVLMFAQKEHLQTYDLRLNNPLLASIVAGCVLALIYFGATHTNLQAATPEAVASRAHTNVAAPGTVPGKVAELGRGLYTDYLFTVEIAGTLLLVATIGAIGVASRTLEADTP